jgi:hypothetical protein
MGYSKECPAVVVTETPIGEFGGRRKCRFVQNGVKPCELARSSDGPNNTHVSDGYCLEGNADGMPDVRSN